jgi:3-deoxy-manno-octulosonate cytidylyltransferase (CMP-KDO synthetase)
MLGWVYRAATACPQLDHVVIATDSEEVAQYAKSENWPVMMTSNALASGTDRVQAVASEIDADIYVNIQADEPLLKPQHLDALLRPMARPDAEVTTISTPCPPHQIHNPNAVKVVTASDGKALYFSRSTIPYYRAAPPESERTYQKHLGIYAYRKAALARFAGLRESPLEATEKLEQLRMIENGMTVYVEETPFDTIGVDTPEDLEAATRAIEAMNQQQTE